MSRLSEDDTLLASSAADAEVTEPGNDLGPRPADDRGDPERIGHYLVLRRLGAGGMGVVYAAYDDQLDRKVALKLLLPNTGGEPRLIREAQALARLSDPNVVQVYEIGVHGSAAFIAMEYIEGETLDAWIAAGPRTREQILRVFTDAGRGLAAAHAKDLIHRDFKPSNVMIRGDGRVCVMDFGLARDTVHGSEPDAEPDRAAASHAELTNEIETKRALSHDLTATGALMGTPAYMAPEQFAGAETGPATDQFGFCVALWEALHGERPFTGRNIAVLAHAVSEGELRPPRDSSVPRWLTEILARGLAARPEDRHPSMLALLDALRAAPIKRRRTLGLVIGAGLIGALALTFTWDARQAAREQSARVQSCETEAATITEIWNEPRRTEVAATQAGLGRDYIDDSMARASVGLDAYVASWSELRRTTCLTREREPESTIQDERVDECFAERRDAVAELVETWLVADEQRATEAVREVANLPSVDQCDDERWLVLRSDPDQRAHVQLDAGDLHRDAGRYPEARAAFEAAFEAAARSGDDLTALEALIQLSSLLGTELLEPKQALREARLGEVFIDRLELGRSLQAGALQNVIGTARSSVDDKDAALVALSRALVIFETEAGPDTLVVAQTLSDLGVLEQNRRQWASSERLHRRALEIRERQLGPTHPDVATSLFNIGVLYQHQGRHGEALEPHQRALAITIDAYGPDHPRVGQLHQTIGVIHTMEGDLELARDAHARALACHLNGFEPAHPRVIHNLGALSSAELQLGNIAAARETIDRALANFDPERMRSWQLSIMHMTAAKIYFAGGEEDRAVELAHIALGHSRDSKMDDHVAEIQAWLVEHGF